MYTITCSSGLRLKVNESDLGNSSLYVPEPASAASVKAHASALRSMCPNSKQPTEVVSSILALPTYVAKEQSARSHDRGLHPLLCSSLMVLCNVAFALREVKSGGAWC